MPLVDDGVAGIAARVGPLMPERQRLVAEEAVPAGPREAQVEDPVVDDLAALVERAEVLVGAAAEHDADRDHVVEPQQVEVGGLQHRGVEHLAAGLLQGGGLPDDLGAHGHGQVVGGAQVRDRAGKELRVPGVVVVVDGDELGGAGVDADVGQGRDADRVGLAQDGAAVAEPAGIDEGFRLGGIVTVVHDDQVPVGQLLGEDVVEGPGQELRAVLGADDDVDGAHAVSLWLDPRL